MTEEQVNHFRTFGFLQCKQLLSSEEVSVISDAFDEAMRKARDGAEEPELCQDAHGYGLKNQVVTPFFDYNPKVFYPLLDDERIFDVFEALMGEYFILTVTSGSIRAGGTGWHHDECAPEGIFSMRAHIYLDALGPDDGCLSVLPGSHCPEFRGAILKSMGKSNNTRNYWNQLGIRPEDLPGRFDLVNEPGDVIFMSHKLFHAALCAKPCRRQIHINCAQHTTPEQNQAGFDWLVGFLSAQTDGYGSFYSDSLVVTAGPRRQKMLARAIELGFGNTGCVTSHLQS